MLINWDKIAFYETVRVVKIRDKRLFFTHLFFLFCIFLYIVVWTFGYKKDYLEFEKPQGMVRSTVRQPSKKYATPLDQLPYCKDTNGVYIGTDGNVLDQLPCKAGDKHLIVFPPSEETSMLVTTRLSVTTESLPPGCTPYSPGDNCTWSEEAAKMSMFMSNIEMFTLFIDHSMDGAESDISRNSKYMKGRMYDQNNDEVDPCDDYPKGKCPKYIACGEINKPDIIPLKTLLRAAGVTLDSRAHPSVAIGEPTWESHRNAGVVLLVRIFYDNVHSFNPWNIEYTYTVSAEKNTEYKSEQPILSVKQENGVDVYTRTIVDRHGLRIIFQQTGKIGSFDFQTLLVNAASSLGLIAIATVIVDMLATTWMDNKEFYQECKFMVPVQTDEDVKRSGKTKIQQGDEPSVISPLLKEA